MKEACSQKDPRFYPVLFDLIVPHRMRSVYLTKLQFASFFNQRFMMRDFLS